MLHHHSQIAVHPLIVRFKVLILIFHVNARRARHLLMYARQTEASFLSGSRLLVVTLQNLGVDKHLAEAVILRHVIFQHIEIDHHQPYVLAYLRCSKSYALAVGKRLPHVGNELLQLRVVLSYVLGNLSQHRLSVCVNG